MRLKLSLSQKGLALVVVTLCFEMGFVGILAHMLQEAESRLAQAAHTRAVISELNLVSTLDQRSTIELIRFIVTMNPKPTPHLVDLNQQLDQHLVTLTDLVKDDQTERPKVAQLAKLTRYALSLLNQAQVSYFEDRSLHMQIARRLHKLSDACSSLSDEILNDYKRMEESGVKRDEEARSQLKTWLVIGLALNVVLAIMLGVFFTRGITRRVKTMADNSLRLASGKPLNPELGGNDELSDLDSVFHKMAKSVEESSKKERAVIENAVDVIFSIGADDKFKAVNPASLKLWGYGPDELIGKRYFEVVAPDDRERTREVLRQIVDGKEDVALENRLLRKDGTEIHMLWSAHWNKDERTLFCVGHDITERHEIERLKQEFVAMVSHDLRTPLSAIQGTLTLIAEGVYDPTTENGQKRVRSAQDSIERLINLINDLLDIEKLEAGMLTMNLREMSMSSVIEKSVEAVQGIAVQKQIDIVVPGTDATVLGDQDRLVQVLVNLLSNAIKFSDDKSTVEVALHTDVLFAEISVVDNGRGIPDQHKSAIFERFKQVEESDGKRRQGTGLGLAICKAIVEAHGGTIGVNSVEGEGSTFWLRIPLSTSS